jgi:hypothetical protein
MEGITSQDHLGPSSDTALYTCFINRKDETVRHFKSSNVDHPGQDCVAASFMVIDMDDKETIQLDDIIHCCRLIHDKIVNNLTTDWHLIASDLGFIYINWDGTLKRSSLPSNVIMHKGIPYTAAKFLNPNMRYKSKIENLLLQHISRDTANIVLDYMCKFNTI